MNMTIRSHVVGHVGGEVAVGVHHALADSLAEATDGESALAVGAPLWEEAKDLAFRTKPEKTREVRDS
ncbi:MAG: hypothetical protein MZV65_00825 [Chromatiales bacterium]|nr:hypothetical protein [Chromatiales bacterium]